MAKTNATMVRSLFDKARQYEKEAARCRQAAQILMGYKLDASKTTRAPSPPPNSRAVHLFSFLKNNGPTTVKDICDKTGVNYATIYCALTRHENRLFSQDGVTKKWSIIETKKVPYVMTAHGYKVQEAPRKEKKNFSNDVYKFIVENGPHSAKGISAKTGLNLGTVRSILQRNTKNLFTKAGGSWMLTKYPATQRV